MRSIVKKCKFANELLAAESPPEMSTDGDLGSWSATTVSSTKLTLQISCITALQIVVSFCIQWYVVAHLGAGAHTDALYAGATIPQMVISLGIDTLMYVLVPLLASKPESELKEDGWQLFIGIGLVFTAVTAILFFATPLLMRAIVPGFSAESRQLSIVLAKVQVLGIVGAACYAVLAALYQVRDRFVWPVLANLLSSLTGFALLIWQLPRFGVTFAAWVQLFINVVPALLLVTILGRFRYRPGLDLLKQVWRQVRPLVMGTAYYRTNILADRLLASFLAPGSLVILDLAQRVHAAVARILNQGIVTPVVPRLSKFATQSLWPEFRVLCIRTATRIFLVNAALFLPALLVAFAGRHLLALVPVTHVAGALTPDTLSKMLLIFVLTGGILISSGLNHTLTTAYYAKGDTVTPTKLGVVTYTFALILKVAAFFVGGLIGIAIAISLYHISNALLLGIFLFREQPDAVSVPEAAQARESGEATAPTLRRFVS